MRPRPVSPYYSDLSLEMAEQFTAILAGETSPEQGAVALRSDLEEVIERGKDL